MMENQPPLTSPDGSKNRNTPERCPSPLYSRDSTQEHQEIPQARPLYSRDSTQEHQEIPQTGPLYSRDSMEEHHEIPQARPLYSRDSTQEHQEIPQEPQEISQASPLYLQDSTQEHQEVPQASPLYSWDSSQEGGSDYRKHLNIVMVESHFEQEDLVDTGQDEPGGNALWKHPKSGHSKESHAEEEAKYDEGGTPRARNVFIRSETKEEDVVVIGEEEEDTGFIPVDLQRKTSENYGAADGTNFEDRLSGRKSEDVSGWDTNPVGGTPRARNVFIRSETKEEEVVVIGKEEDTDFIPVDLQRKTSENYGAADGTNFEDRLSGRKSEDVSGWDANPGVSSEVLTIAPQATGGDKPFPCSECGLFFKYKSSLIIHQHIHSEQKPYPCPECDKQFAKKANYLRHQRLHMGEKQYKCTECAHKQCLVLQQKVYAEIGPFSCSACGANFITDHVTQKKTQKRMRHYTCPDCGDVFMMKSSLTIHQKVHSAEHGSRRVFKENSV